MRPGGAKRWSSAGSGLKCATCSTLVLSCLKDTDYTIYMVADASGGTHLRVPIRVGASHRPTTQRELGTAGVLAEPEGFEPSIRLNSV